ncbi:MAG: hypothetical protein JSR74_12555 [Proteobacteria bacterium]|nr:hypothetical protein [Pseudomonadota bacterium]
MNHSIQELQAALQAMRSRPVFNRWPADLQAVMTDPVRARLVRLEATGRRRRRAGIDTTSTARPARWPPPRQGPAGMDFKSRAAGDRDE